MDEIKRLRVDCFLDGLVELVAENITPDMEGVEIGSYAGESSVIFALRCRSLVCVDRWAHGAGHLPEAGDVPTDFVRVEAAFDSRVKGFNNITKLKSYSVEAFETLKHRRYDFIYIDAEKDRDSVSAHIKLWRPLVKPGGLITGHDYNIESVRQAVNETLGTPDRTYADSSWLFRVPGDRLVRNLGEMNVAAK